MTAAAAAARDRAACGVIAADTVDGVFQAAAERWPDRPLFADPGAQGQTFAEVAAAVERSAQALAAAGVRPGHRIALCLGNGQAFFTQLLALNRLGASAVPVSADAAPAGRAALTREARVAAIVASAGQLAGFADAPVPAGTPDDLPAVEGAPVAWGDEAALLFTSGTTGQPKRCVLSNRYFVRIGQHYAGIGGLCAFGPQGDRILTPLPVTHMNALACSFMAALETGSALIALDRFRASTWWDTVRESRATVVHYLGVMPAILLTHPADRRDREHRVRFGFGAGVDPRHHAAFEARFGFPLIEAWAMTETGAGAWVTAAREPRHAGQRCFGRPGPELDWRILRDDGGDAGGEPGELLVRAAGPDPRDGFFSGYDGDPGATAAAWDGGWFRTGDVVRRGKDGNLFFVDRARNIVRRSGENIAAVEVEGVLLTHPAVAACAVLPVEDELRGEEVMALIVPAPGAAVDHAALHDHAAAALPYFKAPGWIGFVDALPVTGSQKLQRGAIRSIGRAMVADGRAHDLRDRKRRR